VLVLGLAGLSYELEMKKAVVIFSGGIDSISACVYLKPKYDLYGISFLYGQKANQEIKKAKIFAKTLGLKDHKIVNIDFMKRLTANGLLVKSGRFGAMMKVNLINDGPVTFVLDSKKM